MNRDNLRTGSTAEGLAALQGDPITAREASKSAEWLTGYCGVAAEVRRTKQRTLFAIRKQKGKPVPMPPGGVQEFRFHPKRKWRFDWAWPREMVALEIEGGAFTQGRHTRGAGFIADMAKYNEAGLLGWLVLRVTPQQFKNGTAAALVSRAIEARRDS